MRFSRLCLCIATGLATGCGVPQPALTGVEPAQAHSDRDVVLTLFGADFVPSTILDPLSGRRIASSSGFRVRVGNATGWADLDGINWDSSGSLSATLSHDRAQALVPGALDIELTDPRGQVALLPEAFVELGPDLAPPTITFTSGPSDGATVNPGEILRGSFHASDGDLGTLASLTWSNQINQGTPTSSTTCPIAYGARGADCDYSLEVNVGLLDGGTLTIRVTATDSSLARNTATASVTLSVLPVPRLLGITPNQGGKDGGTDVVITGSRFSDATQIAIDGSLLSPNGGLVVGPDTISGHVPAHVAGSAKVTVASWALLPSLSRPSGLLFTYVAPPTIDSISPDVAAIGAAVAIAGQGFTQATRIYFGQSLDSAVALDSLYVQNETAIVGLVPSGSGTTTVWAVDPTSGFGKLVNGFTWRTP